MRIKFNQLIFSCILEGLKRRGKVMDDLEKLETEFLKTPVLKAEYDAIEPEYELIRQLIKARAENKKMTQKQLPEKNRYQVVKYCPSGKKKFLI